MSISPRNLILIGMAASGKSTVGKCLAARLAWRFVDTDRIILERHPEAASLQALRDGLGLDAFLDTEAAAVCSLAGEEQVIATGGSVIYRPQAVSHLRDLGQVIYLHADFSTIKRRLNNPLSRGLAIRPGQTLRQLYDERAPLYSAAAHQHIDANGDADDTALACCQLYGMNG